ncbi:MAG: DUF4340 domain-containing protein [Magnetococcales bacterium]|nr:DUF4340 domain-containing protein [Magnetococcales bacterium]
MSDTSSLSKGWRVHFFLLTILLVAAAVLWWLDRQESQRVQAEQASRAVTAMQPQSVKRIEFWRPAVEKGKEGSRVVVVAQEGERAGKGGVAGRWQMIEPDKARTHDAPVNRLLELLGARYERKVADSVADPVQFGLDQPAAVLTVQDGSGTSLQLSLGLSAPASKNRYLQIGVEGPVVLLSPQAVSGLLQSPDDLRDKRLFVNPTAQTISRVVRKRADEQMILVREKEKPWQLLAPLEDRAAESRVDGWLNGLMQLNGNGFMAVKAEEAFKDNPPDWSLEIETSEGGRELVRLRRNKGNVLAWRVGEPDALVLDLPLVEALDKPVMELVALQPLVIQDPKSLQLQVTHRGKTLTMAKKEGQWPKPVWSGVEDMLTRDAWRGVPPRSHGEVWLTIIAFQGQGQQVFRCWKEGETMVVAPPDRPVELELTHYQTEAFMDTVKALFPAE